MNEVTKAVRAERDKGALTIGSDALQRSEK
jgi:hypothetical protein